MFTIEFTEIGNRFKAQAECNFRYGAIGMLQILGSFFDDSSGNQFGCRFSGSPFNSLIQMVDVYGQPVGIIGRSMQNQCGTGVMQQNRLIALFISAFEN